MPPIIECIPNFSEAKNQSVMVRIVSEIQKIDGLNLVNQHSDLDHNRTVLTMIGEPFPIQEAAFLSAKMASELINLENHIGQHPRIGALDVLPFVPVKDSTMQMCIDIAHTVGRRIATEIGLPVYFYGEAALSPERKALENIRRGEYEGLKKTISTDPAKFPDEGPTILRPAGAVAIGARKPLIAFNVFLESDDSRIAKQIARKVRFSSGGFPAVKALGLLVAGKAQVSMNFTDFNVTNLPPVFEMISHEAEKAGTTVAYSELVGLLPQDALLTALGHYLKLPGLNADMLIESHFP